MRVVKITGQGLSAIALSVALLWAYIIAERNVVRHAIAGRTEALEQIRRLRRQLAPAPVSVPTPRPMPVAKPAFG